MLIRQTKTKRITRRIAVGICGVLAIGMTGAVSVHGGSADEQVIYVTPEAAPQPLSPDVETVSAPEEAESPVATPTRLASLPRPAMRIRVVRMLVTAYCPCKICCGPKAHGVTASGRPVSFNDGHFVAADTRLLPFGTKLMVPGYDDDQPVQVIDRGGAIKGNRLDVFFPTHEQALQWGRRWVMVTVME